MSYQTVLLSLASTKAEVVPSRGAIPTRLTVGGRDVLYMDYDTLGDAAKSVRGGVPLLFPFAGRLPDDRLILPAGPGERGAPAGTTMKQHGFARDRAWTVAEQREDLVRMTLGDDADTRAQFPWRFRAEHSVRLLGRGMHIELTVENLDVTPMPASPGWHPYFCCPVGQKRELTLDAPGFDLTKITEDAVFDFGLVAPPAGRVRASLPFLGQLDLEFSPRMRHLQLWSQPGKPFVCIEPFWGTAGTINGPERDEIPPGHAHEYWMRIETSL